MEPGVKGGRRLFLDNRRLLLPMATMYWDTSLDMEEFLVLVVLFPLLLALLLPQPLWLLLLTEMLVMAAWSCRRRCCRRC